MKALNQLLVLIFFFSCSALSQGQLNSGEFTILNDAKTVELANPHAIKGKLKFIFEDGNLTTVKHDRPNEWQFPMSGNAHNRVNVHKILGVNGTSTEWDITWHHLYQNLVDPEICFDIGFNNAFWYSTYLEVAQPWPYNTGKPMTKPISFNTGSYGAEQFGPMVENLFFNSDGYAIFFDSPYANFFQRLPNSKHLCFTIKSHHGPTDKNFDTSFAVKIYAAGNIQKVHEFVVNRYHKIRKSLLSKIPDERAFKQASLTIDTKTLNQGKVLEQAKELVAHGLKNLQLVLENWEAHNGDFSFDKIRFPDPKTLISELHKLGFIVKLTVTSFVSEESATFKSEEKLFFKKGNYTFTFNWNGHGNGSLWDVGSNYHARMRVADSLEQFRKELAIDSYRFVGGELGTYGLQDLIPDEFNSNHRSNRYSTEYALTAQRLGNLVEIDSAYQSQTWPIFVRLWDIEPSWASLKTVIPTALTMGLANYNFLMAPTFKTPPSEELYIRWLQISAFFPAGQLPLAPWKISDKAAKVTNTFLAFHLEHSTTIIAEAKKSTSEGRPLLRPLWYLAPEDSHTFAIDDQFALGNDLIVAPVLTAGQTQRTVYLPTGKWIDAHGKSYTGPGSFTVQAPLEELPYFKREM